MVKFMKITLFAASFLILGITLSAKLDSGENLKPQKNVKRAGLFDTYSSDNDQRDSYVQVKNSKYPISLKEEKHSRFAIIAHNAMPSVVNIKVERSVEYKFVSPFDNFFNQDPFFDRFFPRERNEQRKPEIKKHIQKSEGSGFIYSKDGFIMTNNHVVEKADKIIVKLYDDMEFEAQIIGNDPETDLAIIKIDREFNENEVAKTGDASDLWAGDYVIAIGSPYSLEKTVTVGVVSAKGRSGIGINQGPVFQDFIQTDAAINPGNSGGPLLDINGKVIGINSAINAAAQGIGFAIPINLALKIEKQLRESGEVKRGYIGIILQELSKEEQEPYGLNKDTFGILIARVEKNTPAEKAGLRADDIIVKLNGNFLKNSEDFRFKVASFSPGSKIKITVIRESEEKEFTIRLGDRSEFTGIVKQKNDETTKENKTLGLSLKNLTENLRRRYNIDATDGVFVAEIDDESKLKNKIMPGDVIEKIVLDGRHYKIENISDFIETAKKIKKSGNAYIIKFYRNRRYGYVIIK